ncbi:MAG TPA: hypothetical protein VD813_09635, partial [Pseudonocardia sp.]|nr:hypothetical protein [Pseudonocardia sp.]
MSPRRTGSRPRRHVARRLLLVGLTTLVAATLGTAPAGAQPEDPPEPRTAAEAAERLEEVQHEAEALTEAWHAKVDERDAREAEVEDRLADAAAAEEAAEAARLDEEQFREEVDPFLAWTSESGNLEEFDVFLRSSS